MKDDIKQIQALIQRKAILSKLNSTWSPHAKQKEILRAVFNDGYKRIFIQAGRKFGKTAISMYIASRIACLKPGAATYIIGPTRKQEGEILWHNSRLHTFLPDMGQSYRDSDLRVEFPTRSFIKVDGSENYESYRGTEYDCMIIDEFATSDPRFYDASYPNLLARGGVLIIIGTAPDHENHHTKLAKAWSKRPDARYFEFSSWDNDKIPGGKEWLEAEKKEYYSRGEERRWEIEFEGRFIPGGAGAIFPAFSKKHIYDHRTLMNLISRDKSKLNWYVICDPGTTSVFGALFIAYNRYTSQAYVLREIYEKDRSKTHASAIHTRIIEGKNILYPNSPEHKWTYGYDEAAAWFRQEMNQFGLPFIPTRKALHDKDHGLSQMRGIMARPNTLLVSEECKNFIWEIQNYCTDQHGRIPDGHDHLIDDFRYFLDLSGYSLNERQVEMIDPENRLRIFTPEDDFDNRGTVEGFSFSFEEDMEYIIN